MLVGETFSGKTSCIGALQRALQKLSRPTERYTINPKSVTALQLYGNLDQNTKIWTDGVIPSIMKVCEADADKQELKWVVFDGPVDAVWIENMNTVLDDNKVLCLTNGQKIKLTQQMSMMFEVADLFDASPATVSRCGIIYLQADMISWLTILEAFLTFELSASLQTLKELIRFNLEWFLAATLAFVCKLIKLPVKLNKLQLTENCLKVFRYLLKEIELGPHSAQLVKIVEGKLVDLCLYSVIWGIGGAIDEN